DDALGRRNRLGVGGRRTLGRRAIPEIEDAWRRLAFPGHSANRHQAADTEALEEPARVALAGDEVCAHVRRAHDAALEKVAADLRRPTGAEPTCKLSCTARHRHRETARDRG